MWQRIYSYLASCGQCCRFEAVLNLLCQNRKLFHWRSTHIKLQFSVRRNDVRFHATIFYYTCRKTKVMLSVLNAIAWSSALSWNSSVKNYKYINKTSKVSAEHEYKECKKCSMWTKFLHHVRLSATCTCLSAQSHSILWLDICFKSQSQAKLAFLINPLKFNALES